MTSIQKYLDKIKKEDKRINAFLQINPNAIKESAENKKGRLDGKVIAVKSVINVKGLNISCASKTLENYQAPYDATVIKKIKDEGGVIIGILNCDEFASGSSGENSAFGPTQNPSAPGLIPGGSSSGSAAAVAADFCDMALGSDTGGSIRNPASHCGLVGLKPTYGSVSRYGLIDLSMSLDQIAPIGKNVTDVALLYDIIKGKDPQDSVSKESPKINFPDLEKIPKKTTVGILDFKISDEKIQKLIDAKVSEAIEKYGWKIVKVKPAHIDLAIQTYYPIVYVEFFSGTRKLDGRRFGKKIEESCGPEVLRRIYGGSEISKAEHAGRYYHQALKAKKIIEEEISEEFKRVDCIISPTVPRLPHKIGEKISLMDMYSYDVLTTPANLSGNCAISIPAGKIDNVPVGMQIMCDKFQEQKLLNIARCFEKII